MRKTLKIFFLALAIIISEGCKEDNMTILEDRNLFIYLTNIPIEREYILTLDIRNGIKNYGYGFDEDPEKNMDFQFNEKNETLKFGDMDFEPIRESEFIVEELSGFSFKIYDVAEPEIDGTGPLLFNPEYGVLAIGNVMAPDFVYLPKGMDKKIAGKILEKLR